MKIKDLKNFVFFGFLCIVPFLKLYFLKTYNPVLELGYIKVFFIIQFIIPLVDCGVYWNRIRLFLENNFIPTKSFVCPLLILVFNITLLFYDVLLAVILLLSQFTAYFNFQLQFTRVCGSLGTYYKIRLYKSYLDIILYFILSFFFDYGLIFYLLGEFIILFGICLTLQVNIKNKFELISYKSLPIKDFLYRAINVFNLNLSKVLFPFFDSTSLYIKAIFITVVFETILNFFYIQYLHNILKIKLFFKNILFLFLICIPIEICIIFFISYVYSWDISLDYIFLILLFNAFQILSCLTLNITKSGNYNSLLKFNIFILLFGLALIALLYKNIIDIYKCSIIFLLYYIVIFCLVLRSKISHVRNTGLHINS